MYKYRLYDQIKAYAKEKGFLSVGFTIPKINPFFSAYKRYIEKGYHGDMKWLEKTLFKRSFLHNVLHGIKTIITFAYPYDYKIPLTQDGLKTARFVQPEYPDYHIMIRELLNH